MEDTLVAIVFGISVTLFVGAVLVAGWLALRGAGSTATSDTESTDQNAPSPGADDASGWSDPPDPDYQLTWYVGESGAQGYSIVHRSDGRQVTQKRLSRESGAVVSEIVGVRRFGKALQAESLEPGSFLRLRRLAETDQHPASIGVWNPQTEQQIGYLSPDASEWILREADRKEETVYCMSFWEQWKSGERTRVKALVFLNSASFSLPSQLSPLPSGL